MMAESPLVIGISQCLLGEEVRYDGGHRREAMISDLWGHYFRFVPLCPEVAAGFGIPREPVRLEGEESQPLVISHRTRRDVTLPLAQACDRLVAGLAANPLHGFILKKGSPSCGLEGVKLYDPRGVASPRGQGLFARALVTAFPLLPVVEEGRLSDPAWRENFITRVFVYHRWGQLVQNPTIQGLITFHRQHKFLLMAHSPSHMRQLGRLVGSVEKGQTPPWQDYGTGLMAAVQRLATRKKQVDVLVHLMGFLKHHLTPDDKDELLKLIRRYHQEEIPLLVPLTLLNHYGRKFPSSYLAEQWYLHPHPVELILRNHA